MDWACEKEGMDTSKMGASETAIKANKVKKKKNCRWVEITVSHSSAAFFIFISIQLPHQCITQVIYASPGAILQEQLALMSPEHGFSSPCGL